MQFVSLLALLILLVGCSDSKSEKKELDKPRGSYGKKESQWTGSFELDNSAAQKLSLEEDLKNAVVSCATADLCNKPVGMVVVVDEVEGRRMCSGGLIKSPSQRTFVATSSHCLPKEEELCAKSVGFVFSPASKNKFSSGLSWARCRRVVVNTGYADEQMIFFPDFAIFELDVSVQGPMQGSMQGPMQGSVQGSMQEAKGAGPFLEAGSNSLLEVSREGFQDMEHLYAYAIQSDSDEIFSGSITKFDCLAVQGSQVAPLFSDWRAPVVSLFGSACSAQPGNSGALVVDSGDRVRGIVSVGRKASTEIPDKSSHDDSSPSEGISSQGVSIVTNLACLDLSAASYRLPEECRDYVPDILLGDSDTRKAKRDRQDWLRAESQKVSTLFEFEPRWQAGGTEEKRTLELYPFPKCYKSRVAVKRGVGEGGAKTVAASGSESIKVTHRKYEFVYSLDSFLRPIETLISETETQTEYLNVPPCGLGKETTLLDVSPVPAFTPTDR